MIAVIVQLSLIVVGATKKKAVSFLPVKVLTFFAFSVDVVWDNRQAVHDGAASALLRDTF